MHKVKQSPMLKSRLLVIRVAFLFIMLLVVLYAVDASKSMRASTEGSSPSLNDDSKGR